MATVDMARRNSNLTVARLDLCGTVWTPSESSIQHKQVKFTNDYYTMYIVSCLAPLCSSCVRFSQIRWYLGLAGYRPHLFFSSRISNENSDWPLKGDLNNGIKTVFSLPGITLYEPSTVGFFSASYDHSNAHLNSKLQYFSSFCCTCILRGNNYK